MIMDSILCINQYSIVLPWTSKAISINTEIANITGADLGGGGGGAEGAMKNHPFWGTPNNTKR